MAKNHKIYLLLIFYTAFFFGVWKEAGSALQSNVRRYETIRQAIKSTVAAGPAAGDRTAALAHRFYSKHDFKPVWIAPDGQLRKIRTRSLEAALSNTAREGLDPDDYLRLPGYAGCAVFGSRPDISGCSDSDLINLELSLTDAFFSVAADLLYGRIDPTTLAAATTPVLKETDLTVHYTMALQDDRFDRILDSLTTAHAGYLRLRDALSDYRRIAASGGWPTIPDGPVLNPGDTDPRIPVLHRRLRVETFGPVVAMTDNRYGDALERDLRFIQRRYGLKADGSVDPATLTALNIPVKTRIRQIELNLERWRWLPQYLGDRNLVVNIAGFQLHIMENDRRVMSMRAVVGNNYRQTPVFSAMLNRLVINPHWYVPLLIAVEDILPVLQKDRFYLDRQGIEVFSGWGADARKVDPEPIDWLQVLPENFSYVLRQNPGPLNPLGQMKFMFPNPYDVYIHDSPKTSLFREFTRTFSSGCIRIEKPVDLASYLLRDDADWGRQHILAAIASGAPQIIRIRKPVPVHLTYWTAFIDDEGMVQFRDDVYNRDSQLDAALVRISDIRKNGPKS